MCYTYPVRRNVTLTVEEEVLRKARKAALDRDTSVNMLVREYLAGLARQDVSSTRVSPKKKMGKDTSKSGWLDGILKMRGMGKALWKKQDPDEYVRKLRGGWD